MKLDLNYDLLGLDGKAIEGTKAGKLLAQTLIGSNKGDALKYWDWAQKLYVGTPLELDPSDTETLKNFVKESEVLTVLAKAQLLASFSK